MALDQRVEAGTATPAEIREAMHRRNPPTSRALIKLDGTSAHANATGEDAAAGGHRSIGDMSKPGVVFTRREVTVWLLAVASLQAQRARGFRLPLFLRVVCLPMLGVEALLQRLANRLTAAGFPAPLPARGGFPRRPWQK